MISTYRQFINNIDQLGFMTLTETPYGLPSLSEHTLPVLWHTGREDDPWRWKDRAAAEGKASYGHILLGRNSFVSRDMYPYLYSAVRRGLTFWEIFSAGLLSAYTRRIYTAFVEYPVIASHEIMSICGFDRKEKSKVDRAMIALQSGMFITVCGTAQKISKQGQPYGWPSTAYTLTEHWGSDGPVAMAAALSPTDGEAAVMEKLTALNPSLKTEKLFDKLFPFHHM